MEIAARPKQPENYDFAGPELDHRVKPDEKQQVWSLAGAGLNLHRNVHAVHQSKDWPERPGQEYNSRPAEEIQKQEPCETS